MSLCLENFFEAQTLFGGLIIAVDDAPLEVATDLLHRRGLACVRAASEACSLVHRALNFGVRIGCEMCKHSHDRCALLISRELHAGGASS